MLITRVLICALVAITCTADTTNQCSDCRLYRDCPEAIAFAQNNNQETRFTQLYSALCGRKTVDGVIFPKICCSKFKMADSRSGFDVSNPKKDEEIHANIELLPQECGKTNGDRIIGGKIANLYEFPWMTLISYRIPGSEPGKDKVEFKCGGSIINSRYILTAAHCVLNKNIAGVRVGEFDISTKRDCQGDYPNVVCESYYKDIRVAESIPHENYSRMSVNNDIALLRLKKPMDFSHKNVAPVCLPVTEELRNVELGGKRGTVAGWGTTDTGYASSALQNVEVPILTSTACRNIYNRNSAGKDVTANKFCAGEEGKDSCSGDSGGPLMLRHEVNGTYRTIQYGVVSYGPQQCGSNFPGVYTDLTKYMNWILDHIKP